MSKDSICSTPHLPTLRCNGGLRSPPSTLLSMGRLLVWGIQNKYWTPPTLRFQRFYLTVIPLLSYFPPIHPLWVQKFLPVWYLFDPHQKGKKRLHIFSDQPPPLYPMLGLKASRAEVSWLFVWWGRFSLDISRI